MPTNRQIRLKEIPRGTLTASHFVAGEEAVPAVTPGTVLVRNRLISQDAANRAWMQGATYRQAIEVLATPMMAEPLRRAMCVTILSR